MNLGSWENDFSSFICWVKSCVDCRNCLLYYHLQVKSIWKKDYFEIIWTYLNWPKRGYVCWHNNYVYATFTLQKCYFPLTYKWWIGYTNLSFSNHRKSYCNIDFNRNEMKMSPTVYFLPFICCMYIHVYIYIFVPKT